MDPAQYMTKDDIKNKLLLYERVKTKDVGDVLLGTRIAYIEVMDGKLFKYKQGGVIIVNAYPEYLVLANNRKSWSVQLNKHIIFKIRVEDIIQQYETKLKTMDIELKKAVKLNKKLLEKLL